MTPFTLHLLRHGAPALPGRLLGHRDEPSTPEGIQACVARAASLDIAALITSDLSRAQAAATAISELRGVDLAVDARWRELDFGAWDGCDPKTLDTRALSAFYDDPDAHEPPQGERFSALVERIAAATAELAPVPTLVVTHGGAMRAALAALCGFAPRQLWAFDLSYAACLSLRVWPGETPAAQLTGLAA